MKKKWPLLFLTLATVFVLSSCMQTQEVNANTGGMKRIEVPKAAVPSINELPLTDDHSLYSDDALRDVVCFYVTISRGSVSDGTDHSFAEVNSYLNLQGMTGVEKIYANALVQVGDESGPLPGNIGYGETRANATINVRGRTSTGYSQKSYRLDLLDSAGLWNGQRAIALNKHPADVTRLRNAVYFRLLQDVPGITSLRTQFVHLYVKDTTNPQAENAFVDYGLYTQVELPNNRYLRNHGLSRDGNLYKANLCELRRYPEQLKLATDLGYDEAVFSQVLEPKTGNDHSKLLAMLDAVNDTSIPIEEIVVKYFDLENLTSYVAFNLLMANPDSNAQNYLLYSPVNSEKWYYLCWDGDGSLRYAEDRIRGNAFAETEWSHGISNYWGVTLFNRMFRVEEYRNALTAKVEELHKIITPERIAELIATCRTVTDPYTMVMPDAIHMQVPAKMQEQIYQNMPYDTDIAYEEYYQSLENPMPFFLGDATVENGQLILNWDDAYEFDNEFVRYDVQVATDWSFAENTIVARQSSQLQTSAKFPLPQAGDYYWRVVATNESGYSQMAFDELETSAGVHGGTRIFTVGADGTVVN